MTLSVLKEVQDGFSFYGAAKMLAEDSAKGIQLCEDAQEKNDSLIEGLEFQNLRSNKSRRNKSVNYTDNLHKNT